MVGPDRVSQLRAEAARFARGTPVPRAIEQVAGTLARAGVRTVNDVVDELVGAGALERPLSLPVLQRLLAFYGVDAPGTDVLWPTSASRGRPAQASPVDRVTATRRAAAGSAPAARTGPARAGGTGSGVLVPAVDKAAAMKLVTGAVRRLQSDLAVVVDTPSWVAGPVALAGLLAAHPSLHVLPVHARQVWVCLAWTGGPRPGTAVRTARRVLSAERLSTPQLHAWLQAAWEQQPPTTRGPGSGPPPVPVLRAWLGYVAQQDPTLVPPGSRAPGAGVPPRGRGRGWWWDRPPDADAALRRAATAAEPGSVTTDSLLQVLTRLGCSPQAATQVLLRCPLLERVSKGRYVRRRRGCSGRAAAS